MANPLTRHRAMSFKYPLWLRHPALGCLAGAFAIGAVGPLLTGSVPVIQPKLAQQPNCANPQTQSELNICANLSFQTRDRELNRRYQTLVPRLSGYRRQQLVTAQLSWVRFRDSECTFYSSMAEGGSMQPMLVAGCKDQLTQQRTTDLNAYLRGTSLPASGGNYQSADRKLNQVYRQLQQALSSPRKRQLEVAELAWISLRDSTCQFESSNGGAAARSRCLIRTTEQRSQQLAKHLSNNAATSNKGLFKPNHSSQSSQMGLIPSLKMILKILNWTY